MDLKKWLKLFLFVTWMGIFGYAFYRYLQDNRPIGDYLPWIQSKIASYGMLAPLVYILFYCLRPLIFFPATLLTAASGALFGPAKGVLYTMIGENLSANLTYILGRYFGGNISEIIKSKLKATTFLDCKFKENGFSSVLIMRLIYLPFDMVGMLAGMCKINQAEFALGTFVGIIPGVITFVYLGSAFTDPRSIIISIIFLVLGLIVARWLKNRTGPLKQ